MSYNGPPPKGLKPTPPSPPPPRRGVVREDRDPPKKEDDNEMDLGGWLCTGWLLGLFGSLLLLLAATARGDDGVIKLSGAAHGSGRAADVVVDTLDGTAITNLFGGFWNASTDVVTPGGLGLPAATTNANTYYTVSVGGTQTVDGHSYTVTAGQTLQSNGTTYDIGGSGNITSGTIQVKHKSDGSITTYAAAGTAETDLGTAATTMSAALVAYDEITFGPGVYDMGSGRIVLPNYCTLRGAGPMATKFKSTASTTAGPVIESTTGCIVENVGFTRTLSDFTTFQAVYGNPQAGGSCAGAIWRNCYGEGGTDIFVFSGADSDVCDFTVERCFGTSKWDSLASSISQAGTNNPTTANFKVKVINCDFVNTDSWPSNTGRVSNCACGTWEFFGGSQRSVATGGDTAECIEATDGGEGNNPAAVFVNGTYTSATGGGLQADLVQAGGATLTVNAGTTYATKSGTITLGKLFTKTPTTHFQSFTALSGTSGGVPYYSSSSAMNTSAALASGAIVLGGGAGAAPATTTTGTGVVTALGVNTGTAGAFQVNNASGASLTALTAANISTGALANGMTATTQSAADNSTKLATTAYADALAAATTTLTNKRITPRITTITSSGTPTINTDSCDAVTITAQAATITSMTSSLSGTPTNFQKLIIRIKDNGAGPYGITWGTSFAASGSAALPTTTVTSKVITAGFIYDTVTSKWVCQAVDAVGY